MNATSFEQHRQYFFECLSKIQPIVQQGLSKYQNLPGVAEVFSPYIQTGLDMGTSVAQHEHFMEVSAAALVGVVGATLISAGSRKRKISEVTEPISTKEAKVDEEKVDEITQLNKRIEKLQYEMQQMKSELQKVSKLTAGTKSQFGFQEITSTQSSVEEVEIVDDYGNKSDYPCPMCQAKFQNVEEAQKHCDTCEG